MNRYFRALLKPGDSALFSRAMSAGFWASALRLTVRVMMLVRTIILARLLAPEDFGLMAVATISILFVEGITDSGVDAALIQKKEGVERYLNTAWTMQIVRSTLTAAVVAGGAPYIASFFGAPEAETIIRVLAIGIVIKGFTNIGVVRFRKDLRFDRQFALDMAGRGTEFVVSIAIAVVWHSVWALVFGVLAGVVVRFVTSYVIDPYRPRLAWTWDYVKNLFGFGKWILVTNVTSFAVSNVDDILVGRYLGVTSLGYYRMAYNLSQAVAAEIMVVTSEVAYPTYAKLQDSIERLRSAYMGTLHFVSFLGFPIAVGTIVIAPYLVPALLGAKWIPIIGSLQLLSVAGLAKGLGGTISPLFTSQGRPSVPPRFGMARLVMMILLLPPAISMWDIEGAAAVVAVTSVITSSVGLVVGLRYVHAKGREIFQALFFPAFNAAVMAVAVVAAGQLLEDFGDLFTLLATFVVGVAAYFGSVALSSKVLGYRAPSDLIGRVRGAVS